LREHPDHHDAELLLRLYELRREDRLREAREWFMKEMKMESAQDFAARVPRGSREHASYRMVTSYWEMAASLVNRGLINEDLFFENTGELWIVWQKIKHLAPSTRETLKNPHAWKNLETVAERFEKWMSKRAPEALDALRDIVIGRTAPPKP
jgi:hypothetical protein